VETLQPEQLKSVRVAMLDDSPPDFIKRDVVFALIVKLVVRVDACTAIRVPSLLRAGHPLAK